MTSREMTGSRTTEWGRLALFVDGGRIWAQDVEDALEAVIARANQVEGCVYHSWTRVSATGGNAPTRTDQNNELWEEFCDRHELEQFDVPQISATGIQLTLDAIDLREEVDALCILSVSHQLEPLFERFREAGVYVVGLSSWRARDEFRNACDEFVQIDDRLMSRARRQAVQYRDEDWDWETRIADLSEILDSSGAPIKLLENFLQEIYPEFDPAGEGSESLEEWFREREDRFTLRRWVDRWTGESTFQVRVRRQPDAASQRQSRSDLPPQRRRPTRNWEDLVTQALRRSKTDEEGWVLMTTLGSELKNLDPEWSPRAHGARNLLSLLDQREDRFEIDEEMHEDNIHVHRHWVRLAQDGES